MLIATIGLRKVRSTVDPLAAVKTLVHAYGGAVVQADSAHEDAGKAGYADQCDDTSGNGHQLRQLTDAYDPQISTLADGRTPALIVTGTEGLTLSSGAPIQPSSSSFATYLVFEPTTITGQSLAMATFVPALEYLMQGVDPAWAGRDGPGIYNGSTVFDAAGAPQKSGLQILSWEVDKALDITTIRRNGLPIVIVEAAVGTCGFTGTDTVLFGGWGASNGAKGRIRTLVHLNKLPTPTEASTILAGLRAHTPTLPRYGVWEPLGVVLEPNTVAEDTWLQECCGIVDTNPQILTGETTVFKFWYTLGLTNSLTIGYAEARLSEPTQWHKYSGNPILSGYTRCGHVVKIGSTYYLSAYRAATPGYAFLSSPDGLSWTVVKADAIIAGAPGAWDVDVTCNTCLYHEGSTWYMFYEANDGLGVFAIGLATSTDDGATWTKHASNPLITGAASGVGGPCVLKSGSKYYCWVQCVALGDGSEITRYESTDLVTWTQSSGRTTIWRHKPYCGWYAAGALGLGQVADIAIVPDTTNGYVYAVYSGLPNQEESHFEMARFAGTLAGLVATDEGIIPGYAPEMLCNTSFEVTGYSTFTTFGLWTNTASDGAIARTTTAAEVHADSSRIAACKLTAGASVDTKVSQAVTKLLAGETYTLTGYARGDGTHGGRVRVQNSSNADLITWPTVTAIGTTYTAFSVDFVAPANGQVTLSLYCPAVAGGVAYFDDLSLM